jgi:hypothetical protein
LIGFIFERDLSLDGNSLTEGLPVCPVWWTSTMKAKAIVGLFLGLRFLHIFGLIPITELQSQMLLESDWIDTRFKHSPTETTLPPELLWFISMIIN